MHSSISCDLILLDLLFDFNLLSQYILISRLESICYVPTWFISYNMCSLVIYCNSFFKPCHLHNESFLRILMILLLDSLTFILITYNIFIPFLYTSNIPPDNSQLCFYAIQISIISNNILTLLNHLVGVV